MNRKRWWILFLCVLLTLLLAAVSVAALFHHEDQCDGEHCALCACIARGLELLKLLKSAGLPAAACLWGAAYARLLWAVLQRSFAATPVALRTKLNI